MRPHDGCGAQTAFTLRLTIFGNLLIRAASNRLSGL
jgi:hypothetical protein